MFLSSEGCLIKQNVIKTFQSKKFMPWYLLSLHSRYQLWQPQDLRPPRSPSPSAFSTTSREQGLICCFISHFTCHILHRAGPATHQSPTPAREMLCKCSSGLWKVKRRESIFEQNPHPLCALVLSVKGKLFPRWGRNETALAKWMWASVEENTSRATRWSEKQSWINPSCGKAGNTSPIKMTISFTLHVLPWNRERSLHAWRRTEASKMV